LTFAAALSVNTSGAGISVGGGTALIESNLITRNMGIDGGGVECGVAHDA
jgi:hypothetical protein